MWSLARLLVLGLLLRTGFALSPPGHVCGPARPRYPSSHSRLPGPPSPPCDACVWRPNGNGRCQDISGRCRVRNCPQDTVCGLDINEDVQCFARSVRRHCSSPGDLLAKPCAPGMRILGFGQGCNFCAGATPPTDPLRPTPPRAIVEPPGLQLCSPLGMPVHLPPAHPNGSPFGQPPGPPTPPPLPCRACVWRSNGNGRCQDITNRCDRRKCPKDTFCGLDINENVECFSRNVEKYCASENELLTRPCKSNKHILGFGQGCNFCVGVVPPTAGPTLPPLIIYDPPGPRLCSPLGIPRHSPRVHYDSHRVPFDQPPGPPTPPPQPCRACVWRSNGNGRCQDITNRCDKKKCPQDTFCGLDVNENVECFPSRVEQYCASEYELLAKPCKSHKRILGFGQGCNFCVSDTPPTPPRIIVDPPGPRPCSRLGMPVYSPLPNYDSHRYPFPQLPGFPTPSPLPCRACVWRSNGNGQCQDITNRCDKRKCPKNTFCGLDINENVECFPSSVEQYCASEYELLARPCHPDKRILGFGQGCNFCGNVTPATEIAGGREHENQKACVLLHLIQGGYKMECLDISSFCQEKHCLYGTVCGLSITEQIECFPEAVKLNQNCDSEVIRLHKPCTNGTTILGFGQGCTFCTAASRHTAEPAAAAPRACVNRYHSGVLRRGCRHIEADCRRLACSRRHICALNAVERPTCFSEAELTPLERHCGSDSRRALRPCPDGSSVVAYAAGCTYCRL